MMDVLEHAADFIWRNARLLERALFANQFLGRSADQVRDVVRACRNPDGGFGHALEADIRGPSSQPLHVEVALRALQQAGVRDMELAEGVCGFLAAVAREDGAVPIALPSMLDYPRAAHWTTIDPSDDPLNPTASLVGLLQWQGVTHPWLERAAAWCWQRMAAPITEAHTLRCALTFLWFAPDRERAEALAPQVAEQAFSARWFNAEPGTGSYGLTPLQLVPAPDAPGRSVFADALINAHLDDLCARQQEDGGWPIAWGAPGPGAAMEWRGMMTLEALTTLRAYGRI
jgi:hypothetical protein